MPVAASPAEKTTPPAAGAVRRTTCITTSRPDGLDGELCLAGSSEDRRDGELIAAAGMSARVDVHRDAVLELTLNPGLDMASLLGISPRRGFRRASTAALSHAGLLGAPHHQLLDDVPVVVLVSGSVVAEQIDDPVVMDHRIVQFLDVCEGGRSGSTMMTRRSDGTRTPQSRPRTRGNVLAGVEGWAEVAPLASRQSRRLRRLDVWRSGVDVEFEGFFRDSMVPALGPDQGLETVIHEYSIRGTVAADDTLAAVTPQSRVLPWPECPAALRSSQRVLGRNVHDFRRLLGSELVGVGTCTHLTDLLRSVEDVPALARLTR